MPDAPVERHPLNVPGPFFAQKDFCLLCSVTVDEAPNLITTDAVGHCYFKKQPVTEDELENAITAIRICCCGAAQYGGDDAAIQARILAPFPKRRSLLAVLYEYLRRQRRDSA